MAHSAGLDGFAARGNHRAMTEPPVDSAEAAGTSRPGPARGWVREPVWRLLVAAGIVGLATLGVATLAALEGWLAYGRGVERVALHGALLAAAGTLFGHAFRLRRTGQPRRATWLLGLLAALTLPYAALVGTAAYLFAFAGERF
jgi:hypothetical protein